MRFLILIALGMALYSSQAQVFIPVSVTFPPIPGLELGNDTVTATGVPIQLFATVNSGTPPFSFIWTPGSAVNNPSLQNPTAMLDSTTTLTCEVIDAKGCQATDDITVTVFPTSVTENLSNRIRIYPNPSVGRIYIEGLELLIGDFSIEVYDITGRPIFNEQGGMGCSIFTLKLSTPGLYTIHIHGPGIQVIQKLVIVKTF